MESARISASNNAEVSRLGSHGFAHADQQPATIQTSFMQQLSRLRSFKSTCENTNLTLEDSHLSFTCNVIFKSPQAADIVH